MSTILALRSKGAGLDVRTLLEGPARPSTGASEDAKFIHESLDRIAEQQVSTGSAISLQKSLLPRSGKSLAERLYDALVEAKVMTAQVAMHLDQGLRDRLFAQLDDLLNIDEWHEGDLPIRGDSFATFLRMILFQKPSRRPGLGLSHDGNLIAAWTQGSDRLTLEFLARDTIRWVLSVQVEDERERAAGETHVSRLPQVLAPYSPDRWFSHGDKTAS